MRARFARGLDWPTLTWITVVHLACAIPAAFFFTWKALLIFVLLVWLTGGLGVCLGYHRYFTHGSFETYRPIRWLLAFLGSLAGQGSVLRWVGTHRQHHQHSDQPGDPHSPADGWWWSHLLWLFPHISRAEWQALYERYAADLLKDRLLRFLDRTYILWHIILGAALFAGGLYWSWHTAMSFLVWGMFVRMVWVFHHTWFVNSATHKWGYRNFETNDNSRNLWWVALFSFGEGWHNNHHANQRSARHGLRWWEIDVTYWTIQVMAWLRLVKNVRV